MNQKNRQIKSGKSAYRKGNFVIKIFITGVIIFIIITTLISCGVDTPTGSKSMKPNVKIQKTIKLYVSHK